MARVQWLRHEGKQVLLLDFRQHSARRIGELAREVQQVITAQPPESVLVLADFTGAKFNAEAVKEIAKAAAANRPYVVRTAWVGAESLPQPEFNWLKAISGRDIRRFTTREEALDFLTRH